MNLIQTDVPSLSYLYLAEKPPRLDTKVRLMVSID